MTSSPELVGQGQEFLATASTENFLSLAADSGVKLTGDAVDRMKSKLSDLQAAALSGDDKQVQRSLANSRGLPRLTPSSAWAFSTWSRSEAPALTSIRSLLGDAEEQSARGPARLSPTTRTMALELAGRAATIAAALMLVAPALWSVAIWNNLYYDPLSSEVTKMLLMAGWLVLTFGGMLAAALMIAATSFALRGVPGVAYPLVIMGYVAAALLVLSPMFPPPILALPVWMLVMVSRSALFPIGRPDRAGPPRALGGEPG